jgi:hypothetical protein
MSNKYGAKRTYSELCDRTFASKAEAKRGEELRLLEMAGEISDLEYQPKFTLCEKPRITITLDFAYIDYNELATGQRFDEGSEPLGVDIYEDVKGVLTRDFRTKLAWLKEKYGIGVRLIR